MEAGRSIHRHSDESQLISEFILTKEDPAYNMGYITQVI